MQLPNGRCRRSGSRPSRGLVRDSRPGHVLLVRAGFAAVQRMSTRRERGGCPVPRWPRILLLLLLLLVSRKAYVVLTPLFSPWCRSEDSISNSVTFIPLRRMISQGSDVTTKMLSSTNLPRIMTITDATYSTRNSALLLLLLL